MTTPVQKAAAISHGQRAALERFVADVLRWTKSINLISAASQTAIWERHVLDSAQLMEFAPKTAQEWVDLGSGGGFPGLVIALLAKEAAPGLRMTLVEADKRKAAFLLQMIRTHGLNARVLAQRIESLGPLNADVISARALADLPKLLALSQPLSRPDTLYLFPKGAGWAAEVALAQKDWHFGLAATPSITDPNATILTLSDLRHA